MVQKSARVLLVHVTHTVSTYLRDIFGHGWMVAMALILMASIAMFAVVTEMAAPLPAKNLLVEIAVVRKIRAGETNAKAGKVPRR